MKHHGILFKGEMIRALIDGRKTQTRRLSGLEEINEEANAWEVTHRDVEESSGLWCVQFDRPRQSECVRSPYAVGDLLYAKETHFNNNPLEKDASKLKFGVDVVYRADGEFSFHFPEEHHEGKWTPSIFMPKKLSRIWLEVTAVRCERVQDITEADAIAEGVETEEFLKAQEHYDSICGEHMTGRPTAKKAYAGLWNTINTAPGATWEANPWVWAYTFKRTERPQL